MPKPKCGVRFSFNPSSVSMRQFNCIKIATLSAHVPLMLYRRPKEVGNMSQIDTKLHRLKQVLRQSEWMNRSILDTAALKAGEDLCDKARDALAEHREADRRTRQGEEPL